MKKNDKAIFDKIIAANREREDAILSAFACKSSDGIRKYPQREKVPDSQNFRSVFFHDTDKIIHSQAFTRYIDKTQVFYLFENDHITHRALHVQFVAKIGRVIGRCLGLNEDLIEAIALGHDIGHPPYGHDGERILHRLCKEHKIGTYFHNAQSVRALMEIEQKGDGTNLSLQVLDGILAHNGEILSRRYSPQTDKTWKKFETEYRNIMRAEKHYKKIRPMTLEGCVARITDIIAYIGRDIEDAVALKALKWSDVPVSIRRILGGSNDKIINTLVTDLITRSYGKNYLEFSPRVFTALMRLKEFNYKKIYSSDRIKTEGSKVEHMFVQLFNRYLQDIQEGYEKSAYLAFVSGQNDHYLKNTPAKRTIVDFIAGMTDDFFNNQFKKRFVPQSYGYSLD